MDKEDDLRSLLDVAVSILAQLNLDPYREEWRKDCSSDEDAVLSLMRYNFNHGLCLRNEVNIGNINEEDFSKLEYYNKKLNLFDPYYLEHNYADILSKKLALKHTAILKQEGSMLRQIKRIKEKQKTYPIPEEEARLAIAELQEKLDKLYREEF